MKISNVLTKAIILIAWVQMPSLTQAAQIITLEINPMASWVQDRSWIEVLPNSAGEIPDLTLGVQLGEPMPEAIYHQSERFSLQGSINVILGRDNLNSIEIEENSVLPGTLPSGREVVIDIPSLRLENGIFPGNSNLPSDGGICACITNVDLFAPSISGVFDGTSLSVDFTRRDMPTAAFLTNYISWIGDPPSSASIEDNQYSFHIEATVVPLPPAFVLLLSAFGLAGLVKRLAKKPAGLH